MGVPKLKRLPDGSTVELQRFISSLEPMNAYFRRLRGDSSPVSRLGPNVLDDGKTLEISSDDMESAFNLFRMPPDWKSFFALAKKAPCSVYPGRDPNKSQLFPWVGLARWTSFNTLPDAWCSTSQGSRVLRKCHRRALSRPILPTAWFAWMAWMWLVRQTLQPTVRPRLSIAFVLHVIASSFHSTLGNGWSGRPLHPFSARS